MGNRSLGSKNSIYQDLRESSQGLWNGPSVEKVLAHSGEMFNEIVDEMAREAARARN